MKYFDVRRSIEAYPDATTYIMVGAGGVGKSYSVEEYCLDDAVNRGRGFCLVGRFKEDIAPAIISNTFSHMTSPNKYTGRVPVNDICAKNKAVERYEIYDLESRAGQIWLTGRHAPSDKAVRLMQVGVYTCIATAERFKRGSYPTTYNIFFDEFITRRLYIGGRSEPVEFEKIVNTIFRHGKDGKIFLCGNPDNEIDMNPYLANYNIFYDDCEPNTIYPFNKGKVAFIKLTNENNEEYIVKETVSIFGTDNKSRFTGEIDRPKTKRIPDGFKDEYDAFLELRIETSGIMVEYPDRYRKAFYLYVGFYRGELWACTTEHKTNYGDVFTINCKYDINELPPPDEQGRTVSVYRFEFPSDLSRVNDYINECMDTGRIYHETDKLANVLYNIIAEA